MSNISYCFILFNHFFCVSRQAAGAVFIVSFNWFYLQSCSYFRATDKYTRFPINSDYKAKVRLFNLYSFTRQHRSLRSFTDHRAKAKLWFHLLPDSVCHAVRPQGPHHAQSLEWAFVLPLLGEFLFFWTLRLHKLLPAFSWAFDVSVQVSELFHGAQGLVVEKRNVSHTGKTTFMCVLLLCD